MKTKFGPIATLFVAPRSGPDCQRSEPSFASRHHTWRSLVFSLGGLYPPRYSRPSFPEMVQPAVTLCFVVSHRVLPVVGSSAAVTPVGPGCPLRFAA